MPVLDSAEHRAKRGLDHPVEPWLVRLRWVAFDGTRYVYQVGYAINRGGSVGYFERNPRRQYSLYLCGIRAIDVRRKCTRYPRTIAYPRCRAYYINRAV